MPLAASKLQGSALAPSIWVTGTQLFMWVLGIQIEVFKLVQQALNSLSCPLNEKHYLDTKSLKTGWGPSSVVGSLYSIHKALNSAPDNTHTHTHKQAGERWPCPL